MIYKRYPSYITGSLAIILVISFAIVLCGIFLDPIFYFFVLYNLLFSPITIAGIFLTIEIDSNGVVTRFGRKILKKYEWNELRHIYFYGGGRTPIGVHMIFEDCLKRSVVDFYDYHKSINKKHIIKLEYKTKIMNDIFKYYHNEIYSSDLINRTLLLELVEKDGYYKS